MESDDKLTPAKVKNNNLKYLLIAAVVAIWATIVYRVIHGMSDPAVPVVVRKTIAKESYDLKEDSFKLYADYPDPFLPATDADPKDSVDQKADPPPATSPTAAVADMAAEVKRMVTFNGIISNHKNKHTVAIVTIRGKEYMVKEKETVDDIKILRIAGSRLLIAFKGEVFTIGK